MPAGVVLCAPRLTLLVRVEARLRKAAATIEGLVQVRFLALLALLVYLYCHRLLFLYLNSSLFLYSNICLYRCNHANAFQEEIENRFQENAPAVRTRLGAWVEDEVRRRLSEVRLPSSDRSITALIPDRAEHMCSKSAARGRDRGRSAATL